MRNFIHRELATTTIAIAFILSGCSKIVAKADETPAPTRKNIELTVYKEDFGVVKEDRSVSLAAGTNHVGLLDVSKTLDQDSVIFDWPSATSKTTIVSSTYDLGIGENASLLKRFLGKPVDLVRYGQDGKESERQHGILEVADPGDIVINIEGRYVINPQGNLEAPNTGIVTIPQLSAEVDSPSKQDTDLDITYLTHGLSWNADYVAKLDPKGDDLSLEVWASITNQTGTDFPSAKISFMAGSPNRSSNWTYSITAGGPGSGFFSNVSRDSFGVNSVTPKPNQVGAPKATGDLYEYPKKTTATIAQNQSNRVRMFYSDKVLVHKDYSVRLPSLSGYGLSSDSPDHRYSATVSVSFKNSDRNGLGYPLPQGSAQVYEPSSDAASTGSSPSLKFVGAADIPDTPQNAGVFMTLSNVFDVYSQCKLVKRERVDKHTIREDLEIAVHNEKSVPIDLRVVEGFDGSWKLVSESEKSKKLDAQNNQWTLHLKAGEGRTVKVSAQFKG